MLMSSSLYFVVELVFAINNNKFYEIVSYVHIVAFELKQHATCIYISEINEFRMKIIIFSGWLCCYATGDDWLQIQITEIVKRKSKTYCN